MGRAPAADRAGRGGLTSVCDRSAPTPSKPDTVGGVLGRATRAGLGGLVAALLAAVPASAAEPTAVECKGLATAVEVASAGEVLQLPPGTCKTNLNVKNPAAFTLEGATGGTTTLEPENAAKPIIASEASVTFTLSGLTFTGATQVSPIRFQGPEPVAETVTLTGNTFSHNHVEGIGGAVSIGQAAMPSAPTVISDNTFIDNSSELGGALQINAGGTMQIVGNTFTGNATTSLGGAVYMFDFNKTSPNLVLLEGNTFGGPAPAEGNTARESGGGVVVSVATGQPVSVLANTFEHNRVTGTETAVSAREGGGLLLGENYAHLAFPVTQRDNVFSENVIDETAAPKKTGLAAGGAGEWIRGLTVSSSGDTFTGNRIAVNDGAPPEGAAVGAIATAEAGSSPEEPAAFNASDDIFQGNSTAAGGWGGAIYTGGPASDCTGTCPPSSLTLLDSTVIGNSVDPGAGSEGGALWGSPNDTLKLENSIVWGNSPTPEIFGFQLVSPPSSIDFSDECTRSFVPSGTPPAPGVAPTNICADPLLAADGRETASSPTIDAGSNAFVPAGLATDLEGGPRIVETRQGCSGPLAATVDMGAFEYQNLGPIPACAPLVGPGSNNSNSTPAPRIEHLSQSHSRWREGSKLATFARSRAPVGTTFTLVLNERATVTLTFTQQLPGRRVHGRCVAQSKSNRRKPSCRRTLTRGALSFAAHTGTNSVSFQGRLSRSRKLAPGAYALLVTAADAAGRRSSASRLAFTIVK